MTEFLRWLLAIEVIGVAYLPFTFWFLRRLPDRGYIFAKILGLLLVTYGAWLLGSFLPTGRSIFVPTAIVLVGAGVGWWLVRQSIPLALRERRQIILVEECIFVAALAIWSVLRAYYFHPGISHTEQYMDMMLLNTSLHSSSYPPADAWMSGRAVNYYYFGYLMIATLSKVTGVSATVAYNLGLSTVFAFTLAGAYSLGHALTRSYKWAVGAPLFVGLLGNWHGVVMVLEGHAPSEYFWFWGSTRVVGGTIDYTINEFPFFSFMLGDLHPHVMALPLTLLVVAAGCSALMGPSGRRASRRREDIAWLGLAAICVGVLFTINSWDFPTYFLMLASCIAVHAYIADASPTWWRQPAVAVGILAVASVVFFAPFYAHFRSLAHGIGRVSTPAVLFEFLQVFGLFFLMAAILLLLYGFLLQPADEVEELPAAPIPDRDRRAEAGHARMLDPSWVLPGVLILVAAFLGTRYQLWTLLLILAIGTGALNMLQRVVNSEEPNRADAVALLLIAVACLVLSLTEVIYLRDSFDGSGSYRMNTVFKFYYQAWVLLGLAGAYGIYRTWSALRSLQAARVAWATLAIVTIGVMAGAYYTLEAPASTVLGGSSRSLDGMAWLQTDRPGDYRAIRWLQDHAISSDVELEATGRGYLDEYARISTFSGLQTVLGWGDHEGQWRNNDPQIAARSADINTMYTTRDIAVTKRLLHTYGVRYVIVGDTERNLIKGADVGKFASFMRVAYRSGKTVVYTW